MTTSFDLDYLATMVRLIGLLAGASLAARLVVGFRRYHQCSSKSVRVAASAMFVYSLASIYGSFTSLVLRVPATWATLVYFILTTGAVLGHRFIGHVEIETKAECP
jgi:hypothetical protein